jgi:hypothetical protein
MTGQVQHSCDPLTPLALEQIEKILHSSQFNGSELLRNLLSYLAKHAAERPGEHVKEYELATDVLGRDRTFDPRIDSAVRVHTSRLRAKLAEYYMAEGAADPCIIEIPKGAYVVTWRLRANHAEALASEVAPPKTAEPADSHSAAPAPIRPAPRFAQWKIFLASAFAAWLMAAVAWAAFSIGSPKTPAAIQTFWRPYLGSSPDPFVVFSNHRFIGTSSSGLHAYREGVDSPTDINDTYSGTGTVMAVSEIGSLFAQFHREIRLKRAELLTWDDAQTANLILVGSPEANSRLRQLPPLQYFDFKSSRVEPNLGVGGIVNLHPQPGEAPIYYGSGHPYTSDYAVVAMLPGLKQEQRILVLAGTNTYGVQAAADFVCRDDLLNDLISRLGVAYGGRMPDFEALLEVKISSGVPVHSRLVAARRHQAQASSK